MGRLRSWSGSLIERIENVAGLFKPLADGQLLKLRTLILPELSRHSHSWADTSKVAANHWSDVIRASVTITGSEGAVVSELGGNEEYSTEAVEILRTCELEL